MENFKEKSSDHIFRLIYVVRNAANYRSLLKYKDDLKQNYWILIFNNFFDSAILEWCKVFGTDNEPTHWKTLVSNHDSFRKGMLNRLGLDESKWKTYWTEVRDYRNNIITHFQKTPKVKHYPSLENILSSTFYYYEWLVSSLKDYGISQEPENLNEYYYRCLEQAKKFTENAYISTKRIKEKVY